MVGKHQRHARDMRDKGVVAQPVDAMGGAVCRQAFGELGDAFAPIAAQVGKPFREQPDVAQARREFFGAFVSGLPGSAAPIGIDGFEQMAQRVRIQLLVFGRRGQSVVGQHQPADGPRDGWQLRQCGRRRAVQRRFRAITVKRLVIVERREVPDAQSLQPLLILFWRLGADKSLEQPERHPLVPVRIFRWPGAGPELRCKEVVRLAHVVPERGHASEQADGFQRVPVVFETAIVHLPAGGLDRHAAVFVEGTAVADDPEQFGVVFGAHPMAGDGRVLAGALAQQLPQCVEARLRDGCLPSAFSAPLGKLVDQASRFLERIARAFGHQQDIHEAA